MVQALKSKARARVKEKTDEVLGAGLAAGRISILGRGTQIGPPKNVSPIREGEDEVGHILNGATAKKKMEKRPMKELGLGQTSSDLLNLNMLGFNFNFPLKLQVDCKTTLVVDLWILVLTLRIIVLNKEDMVKNYLNFTVFPNASSITVTHFNPTFEDLSVVDVDLDSAVLNSKKKSTITFKDNFDPNKNTFSGEFVIADRNKRHMGIKGHKDKSVPVCISRKLNRTNRYRGGRFKQAETVRVSLTKSMNSMIKLIGVQFTKEVDRDSSTSDGKQLEKVGLPN